MALRLDGSQQAVEARSRPKPETDTARKQPTQQEEQGDSKATKSLWVQWNQLKLGTVCCTKIGRPKMVMVASYNLYCPGCWYRMSCQLFMMPCLPETLEWPKRLNEYKNDFTGMTCNTIKYILFVGDLYFTKWKEVFLIQNQEARTVAEKLVKVIARYGALEQIHSDQGRNVEAQLFQEMCPVQHG